MRFGRLALSAEGPCTQLGYAKPYLSDHSNRRIGCRSNIIFSDTTTLLQITLLFL